MTFATLTRRLRERLRARPALRPSGKGTRLFLVLHPAGIDIGSFLEVLASHPEVRCDREVEDLFVRHGFGRPASAGGNPKTDPGTAAFKSALPAILLYKYAFQSLGRKAAGFALDDELLLSSLNAPLRSILMWDRDIHVIRCAPGNSLRTYAAALRPPVGGGGAVDVEPQAFLAFARQLDRMNDYVGRLFPGHRLLRLDSERLQSGASLQDVARFLGVSPLSRTNAAEIPPLPLHSQIANWPALQAALEGTPYARMLES